LYQLIIDEKASLCLHDLVELPVKEWPIH